MNSISYCEEKKLRAVDWKALLTKPSFGHADAVYAYDNAKCWMTCACGTQCKDIPRDDIGKPHDWKLSELGQTFFHCITVLKLMTNLTYFSTEYMPTTAEKMTRPEIVREWQEKALVALEKIEQRSDEILKDPERAINSY